MKVIHLVGGVAMALALGEPALAADRATEADRPCPFLRPMGNCPPQARPIDGAVEVAAGARRG